MIVTKYFKVSPSKYIRSRILSWAGKRWWAIILPLLIFIVLGLQDVRYYIAALSLICIIYPAVMIHVYINHALSPEAAMSLVTHRLVIDNGLLTIQYQPLDENHTPRPRTLPIDEISLIEDTGNNIIIHLKGGIYDFIEVPIWAIEPQDIKQILSLAIN